MKLFNCSVSMFEEKSKSAPFNPEVSIRLKGDTVQYLSKEIGVSTGIGGDHICVFKDKEILFQFPWPTVMAGIPVLFSTGLLFAVEVPDPIFQNEHGSNYRLYHSLLYVNNKGHVQEYYQFPHHMRVLLDLRTTVEGLVLVEGEDNMDRSLLLYSK